MAGNDNYMQDYINEMIANNIQQHGIPANGNRYRIVPMRVGDINDGHGSTGALYLIGFWNGEPIYRTTHTAAHYMEGNLPGQYEIYWPPVFPDVWIPECEVLQVDISIRGWFVPITPPPIDDNHDDDDNDRYGVYGYEEHDDDDYRNHIFGYEEHEHDDIDDQFDLMDLLDEQDEIESTLSYLESVDLQWFILDLNDHH